MRLLSVPACLVATLLVAAPVRADDGPPRPAPRATVHTVGWLIEQKESWGPWSTIGRAVSVEGRIAFRAGTKLRLRKCPLEFVAPPGEPLPRLPADTKYVEIVGRFGREDKDVVIVVEKLVPQPSDAARFRARQAALSITKSEGWYELAAWGEERGRFYEDEELLELAAAAQAGGLKVEERSLEPNDADGLIALAAKAEKLGFPPRLAGEYRHRGWRLKWRALDAREEPATAKELATFAKSLVKVFPGADEKPKLDGDRDPLGPLVRRYERTPEAVYARTPDDERPRLHRAFYAEVALKRLLLALDAKGGNEERVAADVESTLPEHAAVAQSLRRTALNREVAGVANLTRGEMTALAERLRKAGEPGRARQLVADWLAAKEKTLREDGADGLIQAADYYESLVGDEDKVAELLIEAHELAPESDEIATRLQRLGYVFRGGTWTTATDRRPGDANPPRVVDSTVTPGMTPERVVEILGAPRSKSRIATAGQISEVWIYGPRKASGFAIHFLRDARDPAEEGRVVKVSERRPR